MGRYIFLCIALYAPFSIAPCFGQIQAPEVPQVSTMQPVGLQRMAPQVNNGVSYQPATVIRLGATANDITAQQQQLMPGTPEQRQQELQQIIQEIKTIPPNRTPAPTSVANLNRTKDFPQALQTLRDMLAGKTKLSVADAYFAVENAFGNCYLTKLQYDNTINQSVAFIKTWMAQKGLDVHDNYMVHYAIQKFMSEPLTITKSGKAGEQGAKLQVIGHQPFFYYFADYQATADMRNMFITKCLATGSGQCASMPGVYLILAQKLGVKAYLTFTPNHSFIKHPDNSGFITNYEPTSNWNISDKWYEDNFFISPQALRSGVYLDTLNTRQVVANCIFDLAFQYMRVNQTDNYDFVLECLKAGAPYFPNNNNLQSLFIYSLYLKIMLQQVMEQHHLTRIEDIDKVPSAKAYYTKYLATEADFKKLGYQDMPAGIYEELLQEHEFKGKVQQGQHINGKQQRNLFSTQ